MTTFSNLFQSTQDAENCAALTTGGARVFLGPVGKCKEEPDVYKIGLASAFAAGVETVSLYLVSPYPAGITTPSVYLDQGRKLFFSDPTAPAVFVEATLAEAVTLTALTIGTAVPVAINQLGTALTATMVASVWPIGLLSGAESADWNMTTGSESTTRLSAGTKGQEAITSSMLKLPTSIIMSPDDPIFWNVFHNMAVTTRYGFVFSTRPGGQFAWGKAQATNYNRAGAKQTVQKASTEFSMQDSWCMPTAYKYLDTTEKGYIEQMCRLVGIAIPTA
jgi:hypothetical protein